MKKLSIIIPAYNACAFISTALESIYCQEIDENCFSVLVINDGSIDDTISVVQNIMREHSNLVLYNQENQGVSAARNTGIKFADSEYITFLDADDVFAYDSLSKILEFIDKDNSDFLILKSFNDTTCEERYRWHGLFETNKEYSLQDFYKNQFNRGSACGCIYKKAFLENANISFPDGVAYGEDSIFFSLCMIYSCRVRFVDIDFYHITTRENSALTTYNKEKIEKFRRGVEYVSLLIQERNFDVLQSPVLNYLIYRLISRCIHDACYAEDMSLWDIMHIKWIKDYLPIDLRGINQHKNKIRILNSCYPLYCMLSYVRSF